MTLWSVEIKELETLFTSIKGRFPELEKELEHLIKTDDENVALLYSRRCLEIIITDLCECELKRPRKTEPLKGIIDKLNREGSIPSYIIASMQNLNTLSTFGAHPKEFDPEQVKPVLSNLTIIIKWYLKYKDAQTISKSRAEEVKDKTKVFDDATEKIQNPKKRFILLLSGLTLVMVIIVAVLFVLNIIGGENQTKELEKSIAVLPFLDDSQEKENTAFINGIMDEVLINLQTINDLRVPGHTSVEQYRNNVTKSIPEIAKELGVNYIVEGSGQKYGNTFRLRVQLIEAAKDRHVWGDSYEQEIKETKDIFRIQSQVAQAIATELKAIITPEEKQIIEKTPTSSLSAYDFFLRGREEHIRYWMDKNNIQALEKAEKFYHSALEYDSSYAQAFTGLALAYWDKHYWDTYFSEDFLDSVLIYSDIALSFDHKLAEAYSLRGDYYRENGNYTQAFEEYEAALKINPNYWKVYESIGNLYSQQGDYVRSLQNLNIALKMNHDQELPILLRTLGTEYWIIGFPDKAKYYYNEALKLDEDSLTYLFCLSQIEIYVMENYLKALELAKQGYRIDSNNIDILENLADAYTLNGQYEMAMIYCQKLLSRLESLRVIRYNMMHRVAELYMKIGQSEEADYYFNIQKKYCEEAIAFNREYAIKGWAYYDLAGIYAFMGEHEKAYENLQHYYLMINSESISIVWFIKNDPLFESIRDEPEFQQIVRDVEAKYQAEHERVRKWLEEQGDLPV